MHASPERKHEPLADLDEDSYDKDELDEFEESERKYKVLRYLELGLKTVNEVYVLFFCLDLLKDGRFGYLLGSIWHPLLTYINNLNSEVHFA